MRPSALGMAGASESSRFCCSCSTGGLSCLGGGLWLLAGAPGGGLHSYVALNPRHVPVIALCGLLAVGWAMPGGGHQIWQESWAHPLALGFWLAGSLLDGAAVMKVLL